MARIHVSGAGFIGAVAGLLLSMAVPAGAQVKNAATLKNPVKVSAASIKAGETAYGKYCKFCHNADAKGNGPLAPKGTNPPNLTDEKWEHGSTDGEIFATIKDGIGPKFDMKPMAAKMSDTDIWNTVNYLRSLASKK